ncbi:MAG: hypothetical protein FWJ74_09165 [Gemmatimonadota bacterium]
MRERLRVLLWLWVVGCGGPGVWDYVAVPVLPEQDWGDRLHAERGGVRVIAGPAAVFPYDRVRPDGIRERGQYHLYTRVAVHNGGSGAVEVLWGESMLEVPGGGRIPLIGTDEVAGDGAAGSLAPVERLEPGQRTARALIPATVKEIEVGEPMVPLCDGCEYRLVVVLSVAGREERMVMPFRMSVSQPRQTAAGAFWRGWED